MPSTVDLLNLIEQLIKNWGIIIVPLGAFLENSVILGFIFPGVTVIFLTGFVSRTSGDSLLLIITLAAIGAFLGDNLDYYIGRKAGQILSGKPLFAKPIATVRPFLHKHGIWAIFAGRFSSWSRAWVAMACGITKIGYFKFASVSAAGAICWTTVWIIGGYLLGGNRQLIEEWIGRGSLLVWLGFGAILVYYFRTRIKLVADLVYFARRKYGRRLKDGIKKNTNEL